jgi:hypothetical protein
MGSSARGRDYLEKKKLENYKDFAAGFSAKWAGPQ